MLHNFYTLKGGGGYATAFNTVNKENYRAAVLGVPFWAKTLALTDDLGRVVTSPATLEYVNSDPSRGGKLRAMYRGRVDSMAGRKYVKVSLCSDTAGNTEVSHAAVDFDGDGEEIVMTAVVYLETAGSDNVCFCSGDNPFVRRLLGCGESGQLKIGWGDCAYPARPCRRTTDKMKGFTSVQLTESGDGMELGAATAATGCEAVVFDGEVPVIRALRTPSYGIRTTSVTVDDHHAVLYAQNIPQNLSSVRLGTKNMLKLDTCRVYDEFYPVRENDGWNIGANGYLTADAGGKYLAVATEAYVDLYEVDSLDLKPIGRIENYPGTKVYVTRDGDVCLILPQYFLTYTRGEDGQFAMNEYQIKSSRGAAVVREGEYYHLACAEGAYIYEYKISPTESTVTRIQSNSKTLFVSRCGDYIAYGYAKSFTVCSLDVDYTDEFAADTLQSRNVQRYLTDFGEFCMVFREGTDYFVYDFVHDVVTPLVGVGHMTNNVVFDSRYVYLYDHYYGVRRIEGDYDLGGVTGVTIAGDGLFIVRNGRFEVYYCHGTKLALRIPRGHVGESLFANVREKKYPLDGQPAEFTLGFGG